MKPIQRLRLVSRLRDTFLEDGNEDGQLVQEADVIRLVYQPLVPVLTELEHLTILIEVAIPSHLVHHEVLLILQFAKDHGKE